MREREMTREEAIKTIKMIMKTESDPTKIEALYIAIKALETIKLINKI